MNSYNLESLDGEPLRGDYNTRRLREFIPREGTEQGIFETTQEELGSRVERGENEAVGNKREINVSKEVEIMSIAGDRDVA